MPRPRFTLRWLTVVVGTVAVLIWLGKLCLLRGAHGWRASLEERSAVDYHLFARRATNNASVARDPDETARLLAEADQHSRRMEYHTAMARKYEHAARYPWLPVAPDPAEPK